MQSAYETLYCVVSVVVAVMLDEALVNDRRVAALCNLGLDKAAVRFAHASASRFAGGGIDRARGRFDGDGRC